MADQGGGGKIYSIDPSQTAGSVALAAGSVGTYIRGIAFDGARIWTCGLDGLVSIVTPGSSLPWTVTNVTLGSRLAGIPYDGANVWVADHENDSLKKLDSSGKVVQVVSVSAGPGTPTFDGTNIWVPTDKTFAVTVVRASTGEVLTTLSGNGLNTPSAASFDGQRVLVTNPFGNSVSLWNAADLSPLGSISFAVASYPFYACSDGLNFWISLNGTNQLARF